MKTKTKTQTSMKTRMQTKTRALKKAALVRMNGARRTLVDLGGQGVSQLKKHPVGAVAGAFATGVAVAKLVSRG